MDAEAAVAGAGGATLGALVAAWALRGRLREALGVEALEARLARMEEAQASQARDLAALRAEASGEHDSPRARQRASSAALQLLAERLTTLEAEVRSALQQIRELVRRALDGAA